MSRKQYCGLEVEFISFDDNELTSASIWNQSGCTTGAITYYTSDEFENPMPIGTCWYDGDPDNLDIDWQGRSGGVNP